LIQSEADLLRPQPQVLIVAFGNPLRGDDGLAWRTADLLEEKLPPVRIQRLHQLAPEIAEDLSQCRSVIFVDASASGGPGEIQVRELTGGECRSAEDLICFHQFSPAAVLAMASKLYGARPRAFVATLSGQNFDHCESLSPPVEAAIPAFVARIEEVIRRIAPGMGQNSVSTVAETTRRTAREHFKSP